VIGTPLTPSDLARGGPLPRSAAFEWKRGDVSTNTLEGFFSVLKRGLVGVYQHVDKKHLDRYLSEFDFRQNTRAALGINDVERAKRAIRGMVGRRLTYLDSSAW
jgi:hypothetical protein